MSDTNCNSSLILSTTPTITTLSITSDKNHHDITANIGNVFLIKLYKICTIYCCLITSKLGG